MCGIATEQRDSDRTRGGMRSKRQREASRSNGRASGGLAALDRYERRALSRRTSAVLEFDAARPIPSRVSSRQFGRTNPTGRGRRATFWPNEPKGYRSGVGSLAERTPGHRPADGTLAKRTQRAQVWVQVWGRHFGQTNPTGAATAGNIWAGETLRIRGRYFGQTNPRPNQRAHLAQTKQAQRAMPSGEASPEQAEGDRSW
jgi:hypothetical protein